jgi:cyanate lyase
VLTHLRRPEVSKEQGWTVPHVRRGRGDDRVYVAILLNDDRALEADEMRSIRDGAVGTCAQVAQMGENESHALREAAQYLIPVEAKKVRHLARTLDGVAAMAAEAQAYLVNHAKG